jgi:hypothetical protein
MELWGRLGVTCWPTLLLLSPQGVPIHVTMGEGHQAFLTEYLHVAMQFFKGDEILGGGGGGRLLLLCSVRIRILMDPYFAEILVG